MALSSKSIVSRKALGNASALRPAFLRARTAVRVNAMADNNKVG